MARPLLLQCMNHLHLIFIFILYVRYRIDLSSNEHAIHLTNHAFFPILKQKRSKKNTRDTDMKRIKDFLLTYGPEKKYYWFLCIFILIVSFIKTANPIFHSTSPYTYEYGLINPWVEVYHNDTVPMQPLFNLLFQPNMGVAWIPQSIFLDAALIYITLTVANYIRIHLPKYTKPYISYHEE